MIKEIKCIFCGAVTGEQEFPEHFTDEQIEKSMAEIIDSRCDSCHTLYGSYTDMIADYKAKVKNDDMEAEVFVVANPKRVDFDKKVAKIIKDREKLEIKEK